MRVVNLKQRYWIALGAIFGLVVGSNQQLESPADNQELRRPVSQEELVSTLVSLQPNAEPLVTGLSVFPPRDGRNYVTGMILSPAGRGYVDKPFFAYTSTPLDVRASDGSPHRYASITSLLAETSARNARLSYKYIWWRSAAIVIGGWCIGCTVFIGLLWPIAYRLITGVNEDTPEVGLLELFRIRVGRKKTQPVDNEGLAPMSDPGEQDAEPPVQEPPAEEAVVVLDAPALPPPLTAEEERAKRYRGEFYPVVAPDASRAEPKKPEH